MEHVTITLKSPQGDFKTTTSSRATAQLFLQAGWRLVRVVGTLRGPFAAPDLNDGS